MTVFLTLGKDISWINMYRRPSKKSIRQSRASLIILITLAFLLMIAAVALAISLPDDEDRRAQTTTTTANTPALSGFACSATEASQMYPFETGVMKLTIGRVAMLDIRGAERFSVDLDYETPFCVQNDSFFLVAERDGYSFALFDQTGLLYEAVVEGRICGAAIRADGHVAVIQDKSGSTGLVSLYAPSIGEKIFDVLFAESGYVLSVSFPPDEESFDVALLNTDFSEARPVVKRYSLDGRQLGQRLPALGQIYPIMVYDDASDLVMCGATSLAAIRYSQDEVVWLRSLQRIVTAKQTSAGLAVLAADGQDDRIGLHLLDKAGGSIFEIPIGEGVVDFAVREKLAAIGCGTRVLLIDLAQGKTIQNYDAAVEIIRTGFSGDGALTLVTRAGVMRVVIPT